VKQWDPVDRVQSLAWTASTDYKSEKKRTNAPNCNP